MEVQSLSATSPQCLQPVLDEEGRCWSQQLGWDFRPAAELIRKYVASRSLPGYVLRHTDGKLVGYTYYVIDQGVGYLGNLFVVHPSADQQSYRSLLQSALSSLRCSSGVRRIECQLFPFNFEFPSVFTDFEFEVRPRIFLGRELQAADQRASSKPGRLGYRLVGWDTSLFIQAAEVVYDSYQGSPDYELCRDYQSVRGCVRFLRNLIESPGCGTFCPTVSQVALDRESKVAAVLVASRIGEGKAMIPQISVRRADQGRGLGTLLLRKCFRTAAGQGLSSVALSVSEANRGACRLYRRLGFEQVKPFHAFLWKAP